LFADRDTGLFKGAQKQVVGYFVYVAHCRHLW
jgi:hypothetical protein